jgi:entericidin B
MRKSIVGACLSLFVLTGAAALLSACNTVEGIGQDTAAAGRAVSDTARELKR